MKQPGTVVEHAGEAYLCVEGGFNRATRTVTLMAGAESASFPHRSEDKPLNWGPQGDWYPVARWSPDDLLLPDPRHQEQHLLASDVIEHYLDSVPECPDAAWVVTDGKGFRGHLVEVMPQGLAVQVYEDEADAISAASGEPVVALQDVIRFLTHLAREGYAGALWNGEQPVFFCLDELGELQFLRIGEGKRGKVAMEILDPDEGWMFYEGAEAIDFLDNGEACDARLVEAVGHLPILDWPDEPLLWSLGPELGQPGIVTVADDGLAYALLFSTEDTCREWLSQEVGEEETWVAFPVPDLDGYLVTVLSQGSGALLNPGAHRARRGVLWHDGERAILDSFSGFWELTAEGSFRSITEEDVFEDLDDEEDAGTLEEE